MRACGVGPALRFTMPLPKSVLCSSCKKTYPEGWKRCPYCGYSESAGKLEAHGRRFMQQKLREWEQRTGRPREDRPRPGERGADRSQKQRPGRVRDQRHQRGGKPQQKTEPQSQGQRPPLPQHGQAQPQSVEGRRTGRRRRRRGGGGGDHPPQAASPNQPSPRSQQHPQQRPSREANAPSVARDSAPREGNAGPARDGGGGGGERSRRRKRFRRRRRGGAGDGGEGGPPAAPSGE